MTFGAAGSWPWLSGRGPEERIKYIYTVLTLGITTKYCAYTLCRNCRPSESVVSGEVGSSAARACHLRGLAG